MLRIFNVIRRGTHTITKININQNLNELKKEVSTLSTTLSTLINQNTQNTQNLSSKISELEPKFENLNKLVKDNNKYLYDITNNNKDTLPKVINNDTYKILKTTDNDLKLVSEEILKLKDSVHKQIQFIHDHNREPEPKDYTEIENIKIQFDKIGLKIKDIQSSKNNDQHDEIELIKKDLDTLSKNIQYLSISKDNPYVESFRNLIKNMESIVKMESIKKEKAKICKPLNQTTEFNVFTYKSQEKTLIVDSEYLSGQVKRYNIPQSELGRKYYFSILKHYINYGGNTDENDTQSIKKMFNDQYNIVLDKFNKSHNTLFPICAVIPPVLGYIFHQDLFKYYEDYMIMTMFYVPLATYSYLKYIKYFELCRLEYFLNKMSMICYGEPKSNFSDNKSWYLFKHVWLNNLRYAFSTKTISKTYRTY
jgi:hypothetical protein